MSQKKLHISDDLSLPIDAATQTFAFIARKGAGKTYAAGKLTELLLDAGVQVVIFDSVGNWYGLRLLKDGKTPAYDIPVLGGLRGDIPLEAEGGALIADIVADTGRSLVIDISQFSKHDRQKFAVAFGERLWLRKKGEKHPIPVHLVIEESQLIVPEQVHGDAARMVGIFEEIIRLGRNYGIGVTMISQRPQSVNKEVLNQTEALFVGQVNGSQERKALRIWITHQGMDTGLVDELPGLPIGTFYVWSPQWLQILKKIRIGDKKTFDASATPKVGKNRTRRELRPLNLDDLKQQLAAVIERKKAEDPKELRKQLIDMRRQLADAQKQHIKVEIGKGAARVEVPVVKPAELQRLERQAKYFSGLLDDHEKRIESFQKLVEPLWKNIVVTRDELKSMLDGLHRTVAAAKTPAGTAPAIKPIAPRPIAPVQSRRAIVAPPRIRPSETNGDSGEFRPNGSQQRVLDALAWFASIGVDAPSRSAVGFVARIKPTGGHFSNTTGPLSTHGLIEAIGDGSVRLTEAGAGMANVPEVPPSLDAYHDSIRAIVRTGATRRIFDVIVGHAGEELTTEQIGAEAQIDPGGGHFSNSIGPLSTLGLIERRGGIVHPTELMFPPALVTA